MGKGTERGIKNVIICGLGGIGCLCASKIYDFGKTNLKILIDRSRQKKYLNNPSIFNGKEYDFDYIFPDEKGFTADLIIIATKNTNLKEAIDNIKNFTDENTIILSLLNGINSEEEIAKTYNRSNILYSFYIGASCIRENRNITQRGDYNIVLGYKYESQKELLNKVMKFFQEAGISYKVPNNFFDEYWRKFIINVGVNQICAVEGKTLKEIKADKDLTERMLKLMKEAEYAAKSEGIENHKKIYEEAVDFLLNKIEDASPSMLQDIKAGRETELEIFAGEIIRLGEKHKINTSENKEVYSFIKEIERNGKQTLVNIQKNL